MLRVFLGVEVRQFLSQEGILEGRKEVPRKGPLRKSLLPELQVYRTCLRLTLDQGKQEFPPTTSHITNTTPSNE